MQWFNDLVWVGNTLLPRWFILALVASAIVGALITIVAVLRS